MTIEQLLQCDASQLEVMSDATLVEHFKDYLDVTRPERQSIARSPQVKMFDPQLNKGLQLCKELGIDVGTSLQPFKRRKN
jgi:hypothetical protein